MDVHHSPKSRKRGFKALEGHTVHATQKMSYIDSMAQLGSQCLVEDRVPTDRNKALPVGIRGFHLMDSLNRRSRMVSSSHAEREEMLLAGIDTSLEVTTSGPLTAGAYQLNDDEISTSIQSITESLGEESGLNSVEHEQCFTGGSTVSAVTALQGPSPSEVFQANEDRCQSVHFSDMAAEEEIVSESVFQLSDQLPREFSALPWSESDPDQYTSLMATDESNSSEYLDVNRQSPGPALSVNASRQLKKRASKIKLEPKNIIRRPEQSRGSEEEEDPLDDVSMDGLEGDFGQADLVGLATTRQVHGNRVPFVCGICHKRFDSEKYLSMHMPLHRLYLDSSTTDGKIAVANASSLDTSPDLSASQHGGQPGTRPIVTKETQLWTCQHCNKVFTQNSNYKNHMRTHSDERPFVCEICNIGFKERYHLKKHVLFKHTTDLKEKCRVCGKCFKDTTAVRAHERIHSEVRPYSCPLCGKTFKTSECLWHHENRSKTCGKSAKRLLEAAPDFAKGESVILPDGLEMSSARRTRKPRLGGRVSNPRRTRATPALSDSDATKQFSDAADDEISSEMEASLLAIKSEEADCDLFYPNLQTFFHNDQELENILELLDGEATQEGSGAEEEETGSDRTYTDRNGDEPSAKYDGLECEKCGKKFSSSATFAKHMTMHSEERPYRCTLCDNRFKLKVHLKKHHLYRHSNEYPCECSICGKRFKDSSAVRLHEKIHSADRPFRCHCGKSFKTRENLWGHRNRGPCEKNQDFVAQGIGLFQTLEFGTILGVPITNGHGVMVPSSEPVAAPATSCSFLSNPERATDFSQAQTVMMKTAQFVPSCVFSAPNPSTGPSPRQLTVASVKFIKASSNDTPTQLTAALPTAIVTPLPRDGTTLSASTYPTNQLQSRNTQKTVTINNLIALPTSDIVSVDSSLELLSYNTRESSSPTITVTEYLQKNVSSNPSSSDIATADGKCFTVHKFLEMSSETTGKSLGVTQQLLGNPMISDNIHDNRNTGEFCLKRRKIDSISEAQISTDCAVDASQSRRLDAANVLSYPIDQDSQDYGMLPLVDPLLTNSCRSSSIYPDMDDYDDIKYDPNDPIISIGDVYWSDSDNTLLSTG